MYRHEIALVPGNFQADRPDRSSPELLYFLRARKQGTFYGGTFI